MEEFSFSIKSPSVHCAVPRSLFNRLGFPLPLFMFTRLNSYISSKFMVEESDHLNRFLRQKVETCFPFKASKYCQTNFSTGGESLPWKSCTHPRKEGITWMGDRSKPVTRDHDKILSPPLYKQKLCDKTDVSKSSLVFALLSMKWDWKMVLNGLLNWRNDVMVSFTPKPLLEKCIVSVKNSPKIHVLFVEPEAFKCQAEKVCLPISILGLWSLRRLLLLFSYFTSMSICREGMLVRTSTFQTQKTPDFSYVLGKQK